MYKDDDDDDDGDDDDDDHSFIPSGQFRGSPAFLSVSPGGINPLFGFTPNPTATSAFTRRSLQARQAYNAQQQQSGFFNYRNYSRFRISMTGDDDFFLAIIDRASNFSSGNHRHLSQIF